MASPCAGTITCYEWVPPGTPPTNQGPLFVEFLLGPNFAEIRLLPTISEEGYFPSFKPDWTLTTKPSGTTATIDSQGIAKPLDKVGKYVARADCHGNSDTIDFYVYKLEGPPKLVSTVDGAGEWVEYTIVGLPAGTFSWQVIAQDASRSTVQQIRLRSR